MLTAPRFDSLGQIAWNIVTISIFFLALATLLRRRRDGEGPEWWGWIALVVHISGSGSYLPIGPLVWLATDRMTRRHVGPREA